VAIAAEWPGKNRPRAHSTAGPGKIQTLLIPAVADAVSNLSGYRIHLQRACAPSDPRAEHAADSHRSIDRVHGQQRVLLKGPALPLTNYMNGLCCWRYPRAGQGPRLTAGVYPGCQAATYRDKTSRLEGLALICPGPLCQAGSEQFASALTLD